LTPDDKTIKSKI